MANYILRAGTNILKAGSNIFTVGDLKPPVLDLNPAAITGKINNDKISAWADSINNNLALQATAIRQPTYKTNVHNGLPAVDFNGTQSLSLQVAVKTKTIFIVLVPNVSNQTYGSLFSGVVHAQDSYYQGGATNQYFYGSGTSSTAADNVADNPHNKLYLSNQLVTPITAAQRALVPTLLVLDIGAAAFGGGKTADIGMIGNQIFLYPDRGINAKFLRLLIYDFRLTAVDRINKANQLIQQYALNL